MQLAVSAGTAAAISCFLCTEVRPADMASCILDHPKYSVRARSSISR